MKICWVEPEVKRGNGQRDLKHQCRVEMESDGTRRSTGGEVKGKEANGVGSQHSCTVWEHGLSSITAAHAYTSAASSRLN